MNDIDYEKYKEFIQTTLYETMSISDYHLVMDSLECTNHGERWKTLCHNISLDNAEYNLSFVEKSRTFTCFSDCQCNYSLLSLVEKRFKLLGTPKSNVECMRYICAICSIPFNFESIPTKPKMEYNWRKTLGRYIDDDYVDEDTEEVIHDDKILSIFDNKYYSGWIEEGISKETMDKYGILWHDYRKQIVIPCRRSDGRLIGIRVRNTLNIKPKYCPLKMLNKMEYKFPTNNSLYGLWQTKHAIARNKKVVILESEKSVLQLDSDYGDNNYSVALYGKAMSEHKKMLLLELNITECVLGLDWDFDSIFEQDDKTFTVDFLKYMKNIVRIYEYFAPFVKVTVLLSKNKHKKNQSPSDYDKDKFEWTYKNRFMISKNKDKYVLTHKNGYAIIIKKEEL